MLCENLPNQQERQSFPCRSVASSKTHKRQVAFTLFTGKIIGVIIVLAAMKVLPAIIATPAMAAERYSVHDTVLMNTANTIWTLVASFLIFGMQAGFVMLHAGLARQREIVNVLMECIFDTCLCGIVFWAVGYAFMFSKGNGFIGYHWFFLQGTPETYMATGVPILAHWIFQFALADVCSTIVSGAMIGRTSFRGDILYSIGITGLIYPIIGHWACGPDGFLALMGTEGHFLSSLGTGFRDFAGSTVVHVVGGTASLVGAIVLGPRLTRVFKRDGGGMPAANNLTIAAVGGLVLWFGWYGLNSGRTFSAIDMQGIGRVAANTTLAACAGGISAMYAALWAGDRKGTFDLKYTIQGFLGGLVAISCPCYWVSPFGSLLIGIVAGIVVFIVVNLLEYARIDDPIGAVAVHAGGGIWGTVSLGFFATGQYGLTSPTGPDDSAPVTGLFYGGGTTILQAQVIGSLTVLIATFAISFVLMYLIEQLAYPWKLRVEPEGEIAGLDSFEHGIEAYSM